MRVVLFTHSLLSDWSNGNAHFLRGIASALHARGHEVVAYEPEDSWSRRNLLAARGAEAIEGFRRAYPMLAPRTYAKGPLDLDRMLEGADVVLVHEWNARELVEDLGAHRARGGRYRLLFYDTHHRVLANHGTPAFELDGYDLILATCDGLADLYGQHGIGPVRTWREAADTRVFRPNDEAVRCNDVVWIGQWGDAARALDLKTLLIEPVRAVEARAVAYGVRYTEDAKRALTTAGMTYAGWVANYAVPGVYATARATVHIDKRPRLMGLAGRPSMRIYEALACGIPLVVARWRDEEGVFQPGHDYLTVRDAGEMQRSLADVLHDSQMASALVTSGLRAIADRHTCDHRVDELLGFI